MMAAPASLQLGGKVGGFGLPQSSSIKSGSYGFPPALKGVLESDLRKICMQTGAWELLSNLFNV